MAPSATLDLLEPQLVGEESPDSFKRTPRYPLELVPGALPRAQFAAKDINLDSAASWGVSQLSKLSSEALASNSVWRDLYALTGLPRTFFGPRQILAAWKDVIRTHDPSDFNLIRNTAKVFQLGPDYAWVTARYRFVTSGQPATVCSGQIGLIPDPQGGWKIWHLSTILDRLDGCASPDRFNDADVDASTSSGQEAEVYDCCVIGAGFAGLCLSARLKALGLKYVALEKNARVGDNWRQRYRSATFHTSRDFSDFPIERVFQENDPYFLNTKDLARGYEHFAQKHHLNIMTRSNVEKATFRKKQQIWTLVVRQDSDYVEIKAMHFVLAIGGAGQTPVMPPLTGRNEFPGIVLHSAEYVHSEDWRGKRGIVVGTANTGHDVAEDMLKAGLSSVTMIQRGVTDIFPAGAHTSFADHAYPGDIPIDQSDLDLMGYPNSIIRQMQLVGHTLHHQRNPAKYDDLQRSEFKACLHGDLWKNLCGRQGGHYIDVGTSQKIADGLIKVKNGSAVGFTAKGLKFADGTSLEGDVVVFCTGFANDVRQQASDIVGPEVGQLLEDYFYNDDEGEIIGAGKPQGHPGIWYSGGGVHFARFFSRFIALQIQADCKGTPLKPYKTKFEKK